MYIERGLAGSNISKGHEVCRTDGPEISKHSARAHDKGLAFNVLLCYGFKSTIIGRGVVLKRDVSCLLDSGFTL